MFGITNEDLLLDMYRSRSKEMRREAAQARLASAATRNRHGTGRSWLRRRPPTTPDA
ncbi:hypothetical protein [Plantactinospora sp. GCM10030261]|uniref:hypothetical protein n=1 Tax=Plantactinospora sp. GCM10030261 TaxID=3273420 RepID=UPI00360855BB